LPSGAELHRACASSRAAGSDTSDDSAHVAQSVEHLHGKQKVSGSIPLVGSTVYD
jgi:hypothetical protein